MKLSIVIPAYNEETAIRALTLDAVKRLVFTHSPEVEVILIDDGSTDETFTAAMRQFRCMPNTYCYRSEHLGKAGAILAGMRMSLGDQILVTDLDQAVPIVDVAKLQKLIDAGADVAIGSRGLKRAGAPVSRYILSAGQVILKRLMLGLPYVDTQCGFKLWTRGAAMHAIDHLVIYKRDRLGTSAGPNVSSGFDVEMLLIAQRLGYKIAEVPVNWHYQKSRRVNFSRDAQRGLSDLWRILAAVAAGLYPPPKTSSNMVRTMLETHK